MTSERQPTSEMAGPRARIGGHRDLGTALGADQPAGLSARPGDPRPGERGDPGAGRGAPTCSPSGRSASGTRSCAAGSASASPASTSTRSSGCCAPSPPSSTWSTRLKSRRSCASTGSGPAPPAPAARPGRSRSTRPWPSWPERGHRDWTPSRSSTLIERLDIQPTLTAHPTEARRRTVLFKQQRIGELLDALQREGTTPGRARPPVRAALRRDRRAARHGRDPHRAAERPGRGRAGALLPPPHDLGGGAAHPRGRGARARAPLPPRRGTRTTRRRAPPGWACATAPGSAATATATRTSHPRSPAGRSSCSAGRRSPSSRRSSGSCAASCRCPIDRCRFRRSCSSRCGATRAGSGVADSGTGRTRTGRDRSPGQGKFRHEPYRRKLGFMIERIGRLRVPPGDRGPGRAQ